MSEGTVGASPAGDPLGRDDGWFGPGRRGHASQGADLGPGWIAPIPGSERLMGASTRRDVVPAPS